MPRQGVPYPSREICSLKCQIDALNAKINELMKSINGVQGDGQGDLTLVSGDPAIVINNDQAQHEIEIALDGSQLPAAAVSSVNGQTGAVVLEADDIASDGNSDVQADINALKALGVNLQGAISNEVTARGNADAALQGNINTVSAGIPAAAAAAVAADPTVAQLAADVPNKLDKISSGSTLKAYTHNGSTQGEKSVVDGTAADSIAIRDANGRMHAADPASGATDKTLVTANWVSQTGAGRPNNLIHDTGDETVGGRKDYIYAPSCKRVTRVSSQAGKWWKLWEMDANGANNLRMWFRINTATIHFYIYVSVTNNGSTVNVSTYGSDTRYSASFVKVSRSGTNLILWLRTLYTATRIYGDVLNETNINYQSYSYWNVSNDSSQYDEPTTQDYDDVTTAIYDGA